MHRQNPVIEGAQFVVLPDSDLKWLEKAFKACDAWIESWKKIT